MMKRIVWTAVLAFAFVVSSRAQRTLIVDSLSSEALGTTRMYGLLLPEAFEPGKRYPVLYLLHGYSGDYTNWYELTDVETYVAGTPLIVVFPDADDSWYVNSATDPTYRMESYLMQDLFQTIEKRFPIDTAHRAIAGLSMGGYGALLYGLKYPGRFAFAGSLSGAFVFPRLIEDTVTQPVSKGITQSLLRSFGRPGDPSRTTNDVYLLIGARRHASMPYFYMAAGVQDGFRTFLGGHRAFADSLRFAGLPYEYHETPGRHAWSYWDREVRLMLARMREILEY